jgi:hypothetical protein
MNLDREKFLAAALAASIGTMAGCGHENPPPAAAEPEPTTGAEQPAAEPAPPPAAQAAPTPPPQQEPVPEVKPVGPTVE